MLQYVFTSCYFDGPHRSLPLLQQYIVVSVHIDLCFCITINTMSALLFFYERKHFSLCWYNGKRVNGALKCATIDKMCVY